MHTDDDAHRRLPLIDELKQDVAIERHRQHSA